MKTETKFIGLILLLAWMCMALPAMAADDETITATYGHRHIVLKVEWTAAAGGTKDDIVIDVTGSAPGVDDPTYFSTKPHHKTMDWFLKQCITDPGATAPAANYGIAVNNEDDVDLMNAVMADLSSTANEPWYPRNSQGVAAAQWASDSITLVFSDITNANATGTIYLIFEGN